MQHSDGLNVRSSLEAASEHRSRALSRTKVHTNERGHEGGPEGPSLRRFPYVVSARLVVTGDLDDDVPDILHERIQRRFGEPLDVAVCRVIDLIVLR